MQILKDQTLIFNNNLSDKCKKVHHFFVQTKVEKNMARYGKFKDEAVMDEALATVSSLKSKHERDESC